jgi:hypothetical protein
MLKVDFSSEPIDDKEVVVKIAPSAYEVINLT